MCKQKQWNNQRTSKVREAGTISGPPSSRCPEYIPKNTSKYHMIILIDVRYSLSYTLVNVPRVTCILPAICVVEWYSRTFESYAKCVVWTKYDQWSIDHFRTKISGLSARCRRFISATQRSDFGSLATE